MDANKLEVLRSIVYRIDPCCWLCRHGTFVGPSMWGTCNVTQYDHLKHSDATRQLSIIRVGHCGRYEEDPTKMALLSRFGEFLVQT